MASGFLMTYCLRLAQALRRRCPTGCRIDRKPSHGNDGPVSDLGTCLWASVPLPVALAVMSWLEHKLLGGSFEEGTSANKGPRRILVTGDL